MFLDIDGDLYLYNLTTGLLSGRLFSSGSASAVIHGDNDASAFYFWVYETGNAVYKFPFSGSSDTDLETLATEPAGTVILGNASLTNNRVVYATYTASNGNYALKSALKAGGVPPLTLIAATPTYTGLWATAGSRVYFNQGIGSPSAGVINEDGMSLVTLADAHWVGSASPTTATLGAGLAITKVALAGFNTVNGNFGGGALTAYDAASFSNPISLGTIPEGATQVYLLGYDMNLLGTMTSGVGVGIQHDVVFANMNTAGSLARVTNTTGVNEDPLF